MNASSDKVLTNLFRPSVLAWRANYLAAKAATSGSTTRLAPSAARRKPAAPARR